jgi:hypothetical protein
MPTQLAFASPHRVAPEPALDPDEGWREALNALARRSPRLAPWRSFRSGGEVVPSFVLIGPRGCGVPIRLALIAGLTAEDAVATTALAKLLVELDLAPLLAQDYAVFGYPQVNPTPRGTDGREFTTDFWHGSADPAVRFFEHELETNEFDAVLFIQGNQPLSGFQIRTCSRFIADEVLWPAVELAQRFVPLAPEPIRLWPSCGSEPTSIVNTRHLRPCPFCVSLCTPRQRPGENQISALVFGIKQILRHYRAAVGYAGRL